MKNKLIFVILVIAACLRIPLLDKYPAGLNADEAAIGYNAYSLLQTGRDEHGAVWPLVFRSFDDYKPGIYFYLVLPFVAVMGLNIWAIRLPSAVLGIVSVYFIYLLVNKLFHKSKISNIKYQISVGHIAALLLATSPWHIHFSRGGWEVNAASTFMVIGLYFLLHSLKNVRYFFLATFSFVLAMYTYHSFRIIVPLVFISFVLINLGQVRALVIKSENTKILVIIVIFGILSLLPLALQLTSVEGRSRFNGVSIFADEGPLWEALELRRGHPTNSFFARLIHNKYESYAVRIGQNYLSHFSPRFLFITGDEIARSKVPGMGQAYLWTVPLFIFGLLLLLRRSDSGSRLLLSWLFIAPVAAALTFQSPHALRAQNMVYPLIIITAIGLLEFVSFLSQKVRPLLLPLSLLLITLFVYESGRYLHYYYIHYPKDLPYAWEYGFDQIAAKIMPIEDKYQKIIISDRYDQPYIITAFYIRYSPEKFQSEISLEPRDKFGFSTVRHFGKYQFRRIDWGKDSLSPNTLIVVADEGAPDKLAIDYVYDPAGKIIFKFFDTDKLE